MAFAKEVYYLLFLNNTRYTYPMLYSDIRVFVQFVFRKPKHRKTQCVYWVVKAYGALLKQTFAAIQKNHKPSNILQYDVIR